MAFLKKLMQNKDINYDMQFIVNEFNKFLKLPSNDQNGRGVNQSCLIAKNYKNINDDSPNRKRSIRTFEQNIFPYPFIDRHPASRVN